MSTSDTSSSPSRRRKPAAKPEPEPTPAQCRAIERRYAKAKFQALDDTQTEYHARQADVAIKLSELLDAIDAAAALDPDDYLPDGTADPRHCYPTWEWFTGNLSCFRRYVQHEYDSIAGNCPRAVHYLLCEATGWDDDDQEDETEDEAEEEDDEEDEPAEPITCEVERLNRRCWEQLPADQEGYHRCLASLRIRLKNLMDGLTWLAGLDPAGFRPDGQATEGAAQTFANIKRGLAAVGHFAAAELDYLESTSPGAVEYILSSSGTADEDEEEAEAEVIDLDAAETLVVPVVLPDEPELVLAEADEPAYSCG